MNKRLLIPIRLMIMNFRGDLQLQNQSTDLLASLNVGLSPAQHPQVPGGKAGDCEHIGQRD